MDQYIGKLLDNRYEILEIVGTGGMARVYKARCHRLNRLVAIKILREDLAQDAEFRRRFHDESQAIAMLSHPNIVAVYDVSRSSELEYIVMELIDGITLKQYVQKKGNKLNWREALHFIIQITKGLSHAHSRGIIHRDIKPHNIMVLRDGSVKVSDFGIARVASGGHSTLTQETLGSVHYISPEQARGSYIDARSDLYSAGVVLYEMITGRLPFEGDTPVSVAIQHINSIPLSPRELDPSIPEALEAITMKAMAPNPDDRYLSADEMLADLEEFRKNPNISFEYHRGETVLDEELDEDRTQIRPAARGRDPRDRERERERSRSSGSGRKQDRRSRDLYEEEEDYDRRGGPVWPIVLSVIAILMFIGGLVYFLWTNFLVRLIAPPETFTVPSLVGSVYEETASNQELLGRFTLVLGSTEENDAPAGTILSQSPAENSVVGAAVTEITVVVSAGIEPILMPNLYNKEARLAYIELQNLNLDYTYEYINDDTVAKGYVVAFTPLEGAPVMPGAKVQLYISLGPEIRTTMVPSLSERTQEQAIADLHTSNLVEGEIVEVYDDHIPAGYVVGQYPLASTEVDEGTKVNFQVSKGPDPAQQPVMIEKLVDIPLPDNGEIVNLKVMMEGQVIHDQDWDTAMYMAAEIAVTAPEGSRKALSYYWNGQNYGAVTVEFTP